MTTGTTHTGTTNSGRRMHNVRNSMDEDSTVVVEAILPPMPEPVADPTINVLRERVHLVGARPPRLALLLRCEFHRPAGPPASVAG